MHSLGVLLLIVVQLGGPGLLDSSGVTIVDGGPYRQYPATSFNAGPVIGDILNAHLFPAVAAYNGGRYRAAMPDLTYVIQRPDYVAPNPRQAEFMSTAYYLRGMIYFYHATGIGRHSLAKSDFESAIKWNSRNHIAYIELSRVYSELGYTTHAASIIDQLFKLKPSEEISTAAQEEIAKLKGKRAN